MCHAVTVAFSVWEDLLCSLPPLCICLFNRLGFFQNSSSPSILFRTTSLTTTWSFQAFPDTLLIVKCPTITKMKQFVLSNRSGSNYCEPNACARLYSWVFFCGWPKSKDWLENESNRYLPCTNGAMKYLLDLFWSLRLTYLCKLSP